MIIWIRSRKGWVGAVFFVLAHVHGVGRHRLGSQQAALGELEDRMASEGRDEAREQARAADQRIQLVARLSQMRDHASTVRPRSRDDLAEQRQADREGRVR